MKFKHVIASLTPCTAYAKQSQIMKGFEFIKSIAKKDGPLFMSPPSDNVRFVPRKNVRFIKNDIRFSFAKKSKEDFNARGHYCDEQTRG